MNKHLKYLNYVLKHKWFVLLASWQYGCLWRGIIHDLSKFMPSEWFAYVEFFYGEESLARAKAGRVRSKKVQADFDLAWLHHQRRNLHHHQYWLLHKDDGTVQVLEMPEIYVREMVADWTGAGRAIHGKNECVEWYLANREKMRLHPDTRALVEDLLGVVEEPWQCCECGSREGWHMVTEAESSGPGGPFSHPECRACKSPIPSMTPAEKD